MIRSVGEHNVNNAGRVLLVLELWPEGLWFSDLMEKSGFCSVSYFRRTLFFLIRSGVVVEVRVGFYRKGCLGTQ